MSNPLGSELFDTQIVRANEGIIFLKIGQSKGESMEETLKEISLIDKLLILQKSQALLTRKFRLKDQMDNCIAQHLGLKTQNMNRRKR